ncbi:DENN domain-containing protein 2C-like [Daphnia pulicaria]|uniref:DENN domain-containing protein 2C-like n=1 Tax=Daphnia pulicaria TaxID=35523 RepID=UPI001EEA72A8|nr:DENN domain-containing protein 2C-like [Daphnia pulicaria]
MVTPSYDRHQNLYNPYIKFSYPDSLAVPFGVENFCFPDSTHWPPPLQTAGEPYTIVLTDSKGDRMYGYCHRVVPEGAQTCIPITYCLLSRHRAAEFYNKLLNVMVPRHGASVSQRLALLDCLHKQPFPSPGGFVEFPPENLGNGNKVNKVQRLLDESLEDFDLKGLFERLNETVILHVLGTVLLERKLIFVSQDLSALSLCIDAVQSMMYPFVWQHKIVPILPQSMKEISSAYTPFILGLLSKNVEDWNSIYPDQGMLVDLDSGEVLYSVGDESTILPRCSVSKLMSDWEVIVNITQQAETAHNALYSESFMRMFVDLCGHYEQNIHYSDSGHKYFDVIQLSPTCLVDRQI